MADVTVYRTHPTAVLKAVLGSDGQTRWRQALDHFDQATAIEAPRDERLPHKHLLTDLFGQGFWEELIGRFYDTTINSWDEAEAKMNECLAYLLARSFMDDPHDALVANLGPDEAWHIFQLYNLELFIFCLFYAGVILRHDPADESALVNDPAATARTIALFEKHGIEYDPQYWQDEITFPHGADVIPTGFRPRALAAV